jgi:hypothetical protein
MACWALTRHDWNDDGETLKLIIGLPTLKNELVLYHTLDWSFTKLQF